VKEVQESVLGEELTEAELEVFSLVGDRGSVLVDDLKAIQDEVRNLIGRRRLSLVVVQREWGVEFEIQQLRAASRSRNSGGAQTG
jgi:hypothetical protein